MIFPNGKDLAIGVRAGGGGLAPSVSEMFRQNAQNSGNEER